jgi:hypothetical protein
VSELLIHVVVYCQMNNFSALSWLNFYQMMMSTLHEMMRPTHIVWILIVLAH